MRQTWSRFFAYQDEPNTVLVWTDGDWSGNAVTCKSTSAGAVQLGSHTFGKWNVNQQVVLLSSAESELVLRDRSGLCSGAHSQTRLAGNPLHHVARQRCQDDNPYRLRRCAWHDSPSWLLSGETSADALLVASAGIA